jgi:hypothetical protein
MDLLKLSRFWERFPHPPDSGSWVMAYSTACCAAQSEQRPGQSALCSATWLTSNLVCSSAVSVGRGLRKETHAQMLSAQIPIVSKFEFPPLQTDTTDQYKGIQLSYGLGVGLYNTPYGWAFFKEGHDEGWRTYVVCYQNQTTCMVILTNSSNGEGIYSALLRGLLGDTWNPIDWEVLTPYDKLPPRKPLSNHKAIQVPPAFLAMLAGRYGTQNAVLTVDAEGDHLSVAEYSKPGRATKISRFCSISKPGLSGSCEKRAENTS